MSAAEWIAAMRAAGVAVLLDPRPAEADRGFLLQWSADLSREAWADIDAQLEGVGRGAVFLELRRERDAARAAHGA